ncbi:MAG: HD domain-containing protein [Armatimonadota bacterium]|nr:HD domain-containing protein [Armatimonadota bacterium]
MNVLTASGWRNEVGQVVSDVTARLLSWMTRTHVGAAGDAEQVAEEIAVGLCDLMDADVAAVLARRLPSDDLMLLAAMDATHLSVRSTHPEAGEEPLFPAKHVLSVLPDEPFFVDEVEPHLQVFSGELWDFVREAGVAPNGADSNLVPEAPALVVPLRSLSITEEPEVIGVVLLWITSDDGMVSQSLRHPLQVVAAQAGDWLASTLRQERLGLSYRQLVETFAIATDYRDPRRIGHARAVAYYAALIAEEMALSAPEIERVEFAGLLHDLGRILVPDAILQKGAPLTAEELDIVHTCSVTGGEWLSGVEGLQEVATIVRHQGERYDGMGYPDGLSGNAIPLGARILAVALRFSAMTKPRADRPPMSVVGGALEALAADAGSALDPLVVNAFLAAMGRAL